MTDDLATRGAAGKAEALKRFGDRARSANSDSTDEQPARGDLGRAEAERRFGRRPAEGDST